MVLPVGYYEQAFATIDDTVKGKFKVRHSFQTNGTLIDDRWCAFLKKEDVRIGLSIDGPALIHDQHRRTRDGKGSHARTMEGVRKLQEHNIPFHVIAVITADSLGHAPEMFRYFEDLGIEELGFNVEELEGNHTGSSLGGTVEGQVENFWQELYENSRSSKSGMRIREFERAARAILMSRATQSWQQTAQNNDQVLPFRIISVDWSGRISTFSPELMGTCDLKFADFIFGTVGRSDIVAIKSSKEFQRAASEIWSGVGECAESCEYFSVCGGGAPSNKYFENGSFASTSTMYCRSTIQIPVRIVLKDFERKLNLSTNDSMSVS